MMLNLFMEHYERIRLIEAFLYYEQRHNKLFDWILE